MIGLDGIENRAEKPTVIVSPACRAPVALVVKPIVQVERACAVCGEPVKLTAVGVVAAAITTLPPGAAATVSALVATVMLAAVIVGAGGLMSPVSVRAPLPLFAREHEAPVSVIVIVGPVAEPFVLLVAAVAPQLVYPPPVRVTVGVVGAEKPAARPTVIVSPTRSAPVALDVRPIAQVERALPVCGVPAKLTPVASWCGGDHDVAGGARRAGVVARLDGERRVRVGARDRVDDAGDREGAGLARVQGAGRARERDGEGGSRHRAGGRAARVPGAGQSDRRGGGSENPVGKTAVIVSPLRSALVAVKPTVQVERALPVWGEPANETAVGPDAARIVTDAALPAVVSAVVLTVSTEAPGEVFVTPAIDRDAAVLGGSAHEPPLSTRVIVATAPAPVAVAEQFVKPAPSTIVGVAGTEKPGVNVTVMVSPALSAPVAVGVKFTVHFARA